MTIHSLDVLLFQIATSLCSMSGSNCCFLTCIQIFQEAGKVVWYSHPVKNFPQFVVIHTDKSFGIVNKTEVDIYLKVDVFFWNSPAFSTIQWMLAIWSLVPLPFLNPTWTSGNSLFTYCWILENFEGYYASVWDECNCAAVWMLFVIAFIWDWNDNWSFPVLWPLLSFPNLLAYWEQNFHSIIF